MLALVGAILAVASLTGIGLILTAVSCGTAVTAVAFQLLKVRADHHAKEVEIARTEAQKAFEMEEARQHFEKAMMGQRAEPNLGIPQVPGVFERVYRLEVIHKSELSNNPTDDGHEHEILGAG